MAQQLAPFLRPDATDPFQLRRLPSAAAALPMPRNRKAMGLVADVLEQIIEWRGKPQAIRSDNGPEYIGHTLRTWAEKRRITSYNVCYTKLLRFLAATAKVYEAKLVTHDRRLLESGVNSYNFV